MAIDLTRPRGPSVEESASNITKAFDLIGQRERLRQDRQRLSSFVSENIRLTAANPDMDPDQIAQLAAANITEKDPEFDPGILGGLQKFASGLDRGPSTALTGPIAEGLLTQPTGIDKERVRAGIEATRALTTQRGRTKTQLGPTPEEKQRDSDIDIIGDEDSTNLQKNEARVRLINSGQLTEITQTQSKTDKSFSDIMDALKGLRIRAKGNILDKKFGKEAFEQGLKDAIDDGLKEGVAPVSIRDAFVTWWDKQFTKEKGQPFQKFQDRKEFQPDTDIEDVPPTPGEQTAIDQIDPAVFAEINAATQDGTLTPDEIKSIGDGLTVDPTKAAQVLQLIRSRKGL